MSEIKNRELSQFSSFLHVDNDNQNIGIASDATPFIGIGTVSPTEKVHVLGNVRVTGIVTATEAIIGTLNVSNTTVTSGSVSIIDGSSLYYSGIGTINSLVSSSGIITNFSSGISSITQLRVLSGIITNLSGTAVTYTNLNATNGTITNLSGTGVTYTNLNTTNGSVTNLSGTGVTYTSGNFTNLNATNINVATGVVTNLSGSTINYSGLSTFSGVTIRSGIVTAVNSGIVTYYGDGSKLTGIAAEIQVQSESSVVGSSITAINFTNTNGGVTFTPSTATIDVGKSAAGSSGHIQYKNSVGIFSGSSNFTFDVTTSSVSIAGTCSAANFNSTSDINLKNNIETVANALEIVSNLRGVRFNWKSNNAPSIGVIAQELEQVLPELVTSSDPKTVNYDGIIGVLIEAIKELKTEINNLKKGM